MVDFGVAKRSFVSKASPSTYGEGQLPPGFAEQNKRHSFAMMHHQKSTALVCKNLTRCTHRRWHVHVSRFCLQIRNLYEQKLAHFWFATPKTYGDGEATVTSVGLSKPDTLVSRFCFIFTIGVRFATPSTCTYVQHRRWGEATVTSVVFCFARTNLVRARTCTC